MKHRSIEFLRRKALPAALGTLIGLTAAANAQTGRPESVRSNESDSRVDSQSDTTRLPFTIDRPAIHPDMADMGGCGCGFFDLSCWFDCAFGGGTGTGGSGPPSSDPCVQCKRDADRAFNTCLGKAAILFPISTPAYHDAFLECQEDQQNAYIDCSASGPCNDL